MKKIVCFIAVMLMAVNCYPVEITFNIPDGKITRVVSAMKGLYPIPMIEDPKNEGEMIPEFTDNQWAKECVRRFIIQTVGRYEQREAQKAILFAPDNTIAE